MSDSNSTTILERNDSRTATAAQKVFVVLPAYNEQDSLPPLLDAVRDALEPAGIPYSVIVVDDGSCDATALAASQASFHMPVELVEHGVNRGLAAAIRTGLTAAVARSGPNDVIVTMDADNTHPPRLIPGMLERGRGAVVITGSVAGMQPLPLHGVYAATKAFDRFFGEALFVELRAQGIDVVVVEPGPVATEFQEVAGEIVHPGEQAEGVVEIALRSLGRQPSVVSGWWNWLRGNAAMRLAPRALVGFMAREVMAAQTPEEMR